MKKNKYRWREMKDEKPKVGEIVHLYVKHKDVLGFEFTTLTYDGEAADRQRSIFWQHEGERIPRYYVIEWEHVKWRKMCKLPGEK